ncbi:MAG: type II toxin-antitoxin system VapC family toxin [Erysipelotrichaceae bacterium]|nr:type II toxin-antitoxin system VapC family toxin [Erysipelotrichaceae bacterium]
MKYMLDTNIIIYAKNARPEKVLEKLKDIDPSDVCISAITLAELEYGVCNSSDPERNRLALLLFLANISALPFDSLAAQQYGSIRNDLRKKGQLIGANDLLIAAHAKSLDLTLVTNNTGEFSRVEDLKLENWA